MAIIKVLLVDDKKEYCESLVGIGRHHELNIIYELDWENGFEALKTDPKIEFVILDGKGKIEEDQEVEKDNFVVRAMRDIDHWSAQKKQHLPYCVNTGFIDSFGALDGNAQVFQKSDKERDTMFQFIKDEVGKTQYRTARLLFDEPFAAFDKGIIEKSHEHLLVDIISIYKNKDWRKKNLPVQRDLLEAIFKSLNNPIPCLPNSFFDPVRDNKPNLELCTMFLEDRDTRDTFGKYHKLNKNINKSIKSAIRKVKESANEFSHLKEQDMVKYPFLANTFLLMEILEWLPKFVEDNYAKYI